MNMESPFLAIKNLETQLNGLLAAIDLYALPVGERKLVTVLRREVTDARLDIRDYELSETRAEQLDNAKQAKERLERMRKTILAISEYNIFSAVDVAQLTAQLDQIIEALR